MSTYSAKCKDCGRFEFFYRGVKSDAYLTHVCPKCGKDAPIVPSISADKSRNWKNWITGRND